VAAEHIGARLLPSGGRLEGADIDHHLVEQGAEFGEVGQLTVVFERAV
jgi:hypothetical protein